MSHIFISHSVDDIDALLEIHEALRRAGVPARYDTSRVSGDGPRAAADALIEASAAMIVLVSAGAVRARPVQGDIECAKQAGVPLIPFRLDSARITGIFKTEIAPLLTLPHREDGGLGPLVEAARNRYRRRCPVIAVMNLKGGVGKTTVSAQVAGVVQAETGGRVLMIDFDPQYNLTQTFVSMDIADAAAGEDRSVISLFELSGLHQRGAPSPAEDWSKLSTEPFAPAPREALVHPLLDDEGPAGRLDLVSGQFEISKYAFVHDGEALDQVQANFLQIIEYYRSQYDLIIFDTNPNATFLTRCAMQAADRVVAPMHPDIYSLRGVRLLWRVMQDQLPETARPDVRVLFNAVGRSEQSDFEADARIGRYDEIAGFPLSNALFSNALPASAHLRVRPPQEDAPPWRRLLIHHGRGGGLKSMREALRAVGAEVAVGIDAPAD